MTTTHRLVLLSGRLSMMRTVCPTLMALDSSCAWYRLERRMNLALAEEMVRRGWAWISATRLRGVTVMRMMVINYETRESHLRRLVADLERLARQLCR